MFRTQPGNESQRSLPSSTPRCSLFSSNTNRFVQSSPSTPCSCSAPPNSLLASFRPPAVVAPPSSSFPSSALSSSLALSLSNTPEWIPPSSGWRKHKSSCSRESSRAKYCSAALACSSPCSLRVTCCSSKSSPPSTITSCTSQARFWICSRHPLSRPTSSSLLAFSSPRCSSTATPSPSRAVGKISYHLKTKPSSSAHSPTSPPSCCSLPSGLHSPILGPPSSGSPPHFFFSFSPAYFLPATSRIRLTFCRWPLFFARSL